MRAYRTRTGQRHRYCRTTTAHRLNLLGYWLLQRIRRDFDGLNQQLYGG